MIKVWGEYYKRCKKREPYTINLKAESDISLCEARKQAEEYLCNVDRDFRAIRTCYLQALTPQEPIDNTLKDFTEEEIRAYAKELEIKSWQTKKISTLIKDLEEKHKQIKDL